VPYLHETICPRCGTRQDFEWESLGKLRHKLCGAAWYVNNSTYVKKQVKDGFGLAFFFGDQGCSDAVLVVAVLGCLATPIMIALVTVRSILKLFVNRNLPAPSHPSLPQPKGE
jgi:hypothetical protein